MEPTAKEKNERRAADAQAAIRAFIAAQNDEAPTNIERVEFDAYLIDLLANLRHWAASVGVDYARAERLAHQHFEQFFEQKCDEEQAV